MSAMMRNDLWRLRWLLILFLPAIPLIGWSVHHYWLAPETLDLIPLILISSIIILTAWCTTEDIEPSTLSFLESLPCHAGEVGKSHRNAALVLAFILLAINILTEIGMTHTFHFAPGYHDWFVPANACQRLIEMGLHQVLLPLSFALMTACFLDRQATAMIAAGLLCVLFYMLHGAVETQFTNVWGRHLTSLLLVLVNLIQTHRLWTSRALLDPDRFPRLAWEITVAITVLMVIPWHWL